MCTNVTQSYNHADTIKAMREADLKTYNHYRPSTHNKLENYALQFEIFNVDKLQVADGDY